MKKLAKIPGQNLKDDELPWPQRYRNVALRQRQSAQAVTLPSVREQLLRSAEQWEFLANKHDRELGLV